MNKHSQGWSDVQKRLGNTRYKIGEGPKWEETVWGLRKCIKPAPHIGEGITATKMRGGTEGKAGVAGGGVGVGEGVEEDKGG